MKRSEISSSKAKTCATRHPTSERISQYSCVGDDLWQFEPRLPGHRLSRVRLDWEVDFDMSSECVRAACKEMIATSKRFLYLMMTAPPQGRRRWSPLTAITSGRQLQTIMKWMLGEGLASFHALSAVHYELLRAYLRKRPGFKRDSLSAHTVWIYMDVLSAMYQLRADLPDAPPLHPHPWAAERQHISQRIADARHIPPIPDVIAVPYLRAALTWVEQYAPHVLRAWDVTSDFRERHPKHHVDMPGSALRRMLLAQEAYLAKGKRLHRVSQVYEGVSLLRAACVIVIGGLVGMRVSEVLALTPGAIEERHDPVTEAVQTYLVSRLFKTTEALEGRRERWIAPAPAVAALKVLEQINAPMQRNTSRTSLFLSFRPRRSGYGVLHQEGVNVLMNKFAQHVDVPLFHGQPWRFSSHQLRKTFARFVALRDRSHLQALSEHFKHVSLAMTSQAYVGTDFELNELIESGIRSETALALDRILSSEQLAGRMGDRIRESGRVFRGRAGEQVRADYISFIMQETDLLIYACDYGWCVFQPETARCGGDRAPDEGVRSPTVCLSCANMVIEQKHASYWRDRRERNEQLLPVASLLAKAALNEAIAQCDKVLRDLKRCHGQEEEKARDERGSERSTRLPRGIRAVASRRGPPSEARGSSGTDHAGVRRSRGSKKSQPIVHNPS